MREKTDIRVFPCDLNLHCLCDASTKTKSLTRLKSVYTSPVFWVNEYSDAADHDLVVFSSLESICSTCLLISFMLVDIFNKWCLLTAHAAFTAMTLLVTTRSHSSCDDIPWLVWRCLVCDGKDICLVGKAQIILCLWDVAQCWAALNKKTVLTQTSYVSGWSVMLSLSIRWSSVCWSDCALGGRLPLKQNWCIMLKQ